MPKGQHKILEDESEDKLHEMIINREAVPEIRFKYSIFEAEDEMVKAEKKLNYGKSTNYGIPNPNDMFEYQACIIQLFKHIKYMLYDRKILDHQRAQRYTKSAYQILEEIEYGLARTVKFEVLIYLSNYLLYGMFALKFTDLLMDTDIDPFEEFKAGFD